MSKGGERLVFVVTNDGWTKVELWQRFNFDSQQPFYWKPYRPIYQKISNKNSLLFAYLAVKDLNQNKFFLWASFIAHIKILYYESLKMWYDAISQYFC